MVEPRNMARYFGFTKDEVRMLAGGRCKVNPTRFQNDMSVVGSKDDVLTVLIHLKGPMPPSLRCHAAVEPVEADENANLQQRAQQIVYAKACRTLAEQVEECRVEE